MISKPKPDSSGSASVSSLSAKRRASGFASRVARAVAIARRRDRAVDAKEARLEAPPAQAPLLERCAKRGSELGEHRQDVGALCDRLGKAPLGAADGHDPARRDRSVESARRAVEGNEKRGAEAGGERRARAVHEIADALEPHAHESDGDIRREGEGDDGERSYAHCILAGGHDAPRPEPRESARCVGSPRNGAHCADPRPLEIADDFREERPLAAREMRAARDVEHEAVGEIDGDDRREAVAPVADLREEGGVFRRRRLGDGKVGNARAGVGEREAGLEPEGSRAGVEGDEA